MKNMIYFANTACYNRDMADFGEKKSEQVLINITPTTLNMLRQVMVIEGRALGYVARELMLRGLDSYVDDGSLRGPEIDSGREAAKRAIAEGIRQAIPEPKTKLAPAVVSHPSSKKVVRDMFGLEEIQRTINDDELAEAKRRTTPRMKAEVRSGKVK